MIDVSVPTAKSDFLWENFVKNNHENIGRYLKSPVYRAEMSSVEHPKKMSNENEKSILILKFYFVLILLNIKY